MPGRRSTIPPLTPKVGKKRKKNRSLNALAVAEQRNPFQSKIRSNRLGEIEQGVSKRKRVEEKDVSDQDDLSQPARKRRGASKDRFGHDIEVGSDSDGNKWVIGQVDSEDDSDLDSDEAMGESEERFARFTFRGSSSKADKKLRHKAWKPGQEDNEPLEIDLREDETSQHGSDEGVDELGDDAIDLAAMLDASDSAPEDSSSTGSIEEQEHDDAGLSADDSGLDAEGLTDGEDSVLSISENENEASDPVKLASLQAFISGIHGNSSSTSQAHKSTRDVHESIAPSDFGLISTKKLTVADLISSVTDPHLKKPLKLLINNDITSSGKRSGMLKKLDVPLAKRQQDRLDRAAAYVKSKETLNRWIDTVRHNRRAEHLKFPLQDPSAVGAQGKQRLIPTIQSRPITDLENAIQNILQDSGLDSTKPDSLEDQPNTFGDLQTNKISVEGVQARRAELRRARDLLFREETRARRIKKIKSKSYRRIHRKERERNAVYEKDALVAAGVDDSESEKERNNRRRAEERMGTRHRESKWARSVKDTGRARWDEDARNGVIEMARRGEDLRRRIEGKQGSAEEDDSSTSESVFDDENDHFGVEHENIKTAQRAQNRLDRVSGRDDERENGLSANRSDLSSLAFMKKAEALRKARNDVEVETIRREIAGEVRLSEPEETEALGRRSFGPMKNRNPFSEGLAQKKQKSEFEETADPGTDEESFQGFVEENKQEIIVDKLTTKERNVSTRKGKISHARGLKSENLENPWLSTQTSSKPTNRKIRHSHEVAIISNSLPMNDVNTCNSESQAQPLPGHGKFKSLQTVIQAVKADSSNQTSESDDDEGETSRLPFVMRNEELVRKAFAGDEVVAAFEKEKEETMRDEEDKVIDNTLPGWGNWIGAGVSKKEQKHSMGKVLEKVEGIQKDKRQDAKLDHVIINQKRVKKVGLAAHNVLPLCLMMIECQVPRIELTTSFRDQTTI